MKTFHSSDRRRSGIVFALAMCGLISCQPPPSTSRCEFGGRDAEFRQTSGSACATSARTRLPAGTFFASMLDRPMSNCASDWSRNATSPARRLTPTARQLSMRWARRSHNRRGESSGWLNRSGGHPNLVLDYDSEDPIGRTMNRGENQSHPCAHALVVLKY